MFENSKNVCLYLSSFCSNNKCPELDTCPRYFYLTTQIYICAFPRKCCVKPDNFFFLFIQMLRAGERISFRERSRRSLGTPQVRFNLTHPNRDGRCALDCTESTRDCGQTRTGRQNRTIQTRHRRQDSLSLSLVRCSQQSFKLALAGQKTNPGRPPLVVRSTSNRL